MNKGSNSRRSRGRGKGQRPQKSHHSNFDSNGPEGRVRGNAQQVYEKYMTLARDAMASGDRIATENYFQHAEHYLRVIMAQDNGNGRLDAFRRRSQFGPFGTEEFGDEGDEEQGEGENQDAGQQRAPQGEGSGESREANAGARKVPIEQPENGSPQQGEGGDDRDDDEGLRRTLAL